MRAVDAEFKPTVATIGLVSKIHPGKIKEETGNVVIRVELESQTATPVDNPSAFLVFQPDWLSYGREELEGLSKSGKFLYGRNLVALPGQGSISLLQALAGFQTEDDQWPVLNESVNALVANGGFDLEEFQSLVSTVAENREILFDLRQRTEKADVGGKTEYVKVDGYNVDVCFPYKDFFIKKAQARALKAKKKFEESGEELGFKCPSYVVSWEVSKS